ncbi:MAG: dihydrodipicolinate synthase family protein [Chitinophagaceae bacterium]
MQPLRSDEIYGTWGTVLLPIKDDDNIDYVKLETFLDQLISSGINGIYSNGTAGEFYNQTEEEFEKISALLAEKCHNANLPFQIGCAHTSPLVTLERIKKIKTLAPGAIQVILPDWYPPTMSEIISYLKVLEAAAYPIGLVLYNPPHAKKILTPTDFYQIQQAGISLAGCKVAGGDQHWYEEIRTLVPELSVFVPGHHLATGIKSGAKGSYSNVACINPKAAQSWYEMMHIDMDSALELQSRIQVFISDQILPLIIKEHYSSAAIDKFLAAITNWAEVGTKIRWPYQSIDPARTAKVAEAARQTIPEFFEK